ncbi:MAG: adenosine kinase [Alphaproteobacteria bacterium]|jgi:sugar/nucleoside kinase (ribokinase family)|nr:adenosine kinase [Alphaproteobacteria bacterium]
MPQQYDVASLGNAIVDIIASVDDRFLLTHRIAKGTMTLIDEFRAKELLRALADNQQTMSSLHQVAGGSAANTMAGLASLGGNGLFLGKVSDDRLGKVFGDSMAAAGVTFHNGSSKTGASTASSMIAVTPDGQRSMNTFLGACREMVPDDVDEEQVAAARLLYIEGYLWDEESAKQASRKAIAAVKGAGGRIALSLSDPFCVGRFREEFLHLLDKDVSVLFANEEEAKALFQVQDFDGVIAGAKKWGGIAALTRSAKGCVIVEEGMVHEIPAAPVSQVIDTTGAGDQYAAGFLYGLTHGKGLADCGRLGALAAAEVISHYGARPETSLKDLAAKAGLI